MTLLTAHEAEIIWVQLTKRSLQMGEGDHPDRAALDSAIAKIEPLLSPEFRVAFANAVEAHS